MIIHMNPLRRVRIPEPGIQNRDRKMESENLQTARPRGQVPCEEEVPDAAHHLGRRAEDALLQGNRRFRLPVQASVPKLRPS